MQCVYSVLSWKTITAFYNTKMLLSQSETSSIDQEDKKDRESVNEERDETIVEDIPEKATSEKVSCTTDFVNGDLSCFEDLKLKV